MTTFSSVSGTTITLDTFPAKGCCPECGKKGRLVKNAKDFWFHHCPDHGDWGYGLYADQVTHVIDWDKAKEEA